MIKSNKIQAAAESWPEKEIKGFGTKRRESVKIMPQNYLKKKRLKWKTKLDNKLWRNHRRDGGHQVETCTDFQSESNG